MLGLQPKTISGLFHLQLLFPGHCFYSVLWGGNVQSTAFRVRRFSAVGVVLSSWFYCIVVGNTLWLWQMHFQAFPNATRLHNSLSELKHHGNGLYIFAFSVVSEHVF